MTTHPSCVLDLPFSLWLQLNLKGGSELGDRRASECHLATLTMNSSDVKNRPICLLFAHDADASNATISQCRQWTSRTIYYLYAHHDTPIPFCVRAVLLLLYVCLCRNAESTCFTTTLSQQPTRVVCVRVYVLVCVRACGAR